ncbi:hypothetical protein D9758_005377 [Tetrapyrgos nigripes]|uniref:Uncharacterized protein n=1 Tax=Tetrapyrgos nigripes TaxID=182062 RepID=A0A8H5GIA5_9AGAR|nr:hypothetical protein D9758_005377 [Tetrapyrgos nigripes]
MPHGHVQGNLNCVVTRNGWTRHVSLTPYETTNMCYATLESLLELDSFKSRDNKPCVYVEHPPASGSFNKITPWRRDGSLQTMLVNDFFDQRLKNGITTYLVVREEESQTYRPVSPSRSRSQPAAKQWWKGGLGTRKNSQVDDLPPKVPDKSHYTPSLNSLVPSGSGLLRYSDAVSFHDIKWRSPTTSSPSHSPVLNSSRSMVNLNLDRVEKNDEYTLDGQWRKVMSMESNDAYPSTDSSGYLSPNYERKDSYFPLALQGSPLNHCEIRLCIKDDALSSRQRSESLQSDSSQSQDFPQEVGSFSSSELDFDSF